MGIWKRIFGCRHQYHVTISTLHHGVTNGMSVQQPYYSYKREEYDFCLKCGESKPKPPIGEGR